MIMLSVYPERMLYAVNNEMEVDYTAYLEKFFYTHSQNFVFLSVLSSGIFPALMFAWLMS